MLRVLVVVDGKSRLQDKKIGSVLDSLPESLAVQLNNATDLISTIRPVEISEFDCVVLDAALPAETALSFMQTLWIDNFPPTVIISSETHHLSREQWVQIGAWEVLDESTLTSEGFLQVLQCATRVRQAEQQTRLAQQRLQQSDCLLMRQCQLIDQQQQHIHHLNRQLTEATQLKQQFLSIVSHELRTPMNAIIGFSQLLLRQRESALANHQVNLVDRISTNAKHLMTLIEEILEFSRIEAGSLKHQPCCIDLEHLIQALVQEFQGTADQQKLELAVQLNLANPELMVDPNHLQRALFKLISNAIKFTATGSVTIRADDLEGDRIVISVQDTGVGIQSSELEHIFEPFRQVDQSNTRGHCGMGLGLTVTAALIRQMQGNISVCSRMGEGSEFRVELPRQLNHTALGHFQTISAH